MPLPTIFVSIASYRDPECQWTVRDVFNKAAHPERVFVGICWQRVLPDDTACFTIPSPRPMQTRVIEYDAMQSRGACWAKYQANQLYRGEDYWLMIDSHMRFEPGWDEAMLEMLCETGAAHPLLTCYPAAYTPPDQRNPGTSHLAAKAFHEHTGILHLQGIAKPFERPLRTAFIAGGFVFAPAEFFLTVPVDPHLYFYGEEITFAVRAFTHGWDSYSPHRCVIYHYYGRQTFPKHWSDHTQWHVLEQRSVKRVKHLLGVMPADDPETLVELERYGLGARRSLADYQAFSGVDFVAQTIAPFAMQGQFEKDAP